MKTKLKPQEEAELYCGAFNSQLETNDNLSFFLNEAEHARDKALYYLLRFCEASEREGWVLSAEAQQMREEALNVLFENNIYTGLPEPDDAILRLMQAVAFDAEDGRVGKQRHCTNSPMETQILLYQNLGEDRRIHAGDESASLRANAFKFALQRVVECKRAETLRLTAFRLSPVPDTN